MSRFSIIDWMIFFRNIMNHEFDTRDEYRCDDLCS